MAGILKDQIKDAILQSNSWECHHLCRISDKDCHSCKAKVKEIKSLKKNIIDLEKKLSGVNADLETHYSRITDLEDRLSKERNLRKRFEKDFHDLEELQKERRMCFSSSDSDDDRNKNSSSPSDTDDAGKRYNKDNKRKNEKSRNSQSKSMRKFKGESRSRVCRRYLKKTTQVVRVLFRAKLLMFDLKTSLKRKYTSYSCPFCGAEPETFDHLFKCTNGIHCPQSLKHVTLQNLANTNDIDRLKQIGCFLLKYQMYRNVYEGK